MRRPLALVLLAVLLVACNSSQPQGDVGTGPAAGAAVAVEIDAEQTFAPATLSLPAGERVTLQITNADGDAHDFAVVAAGLNTGTIQPGGVATATLTVPAGTTPFVCTFHPEMRGTIEGA
jgi:plastocyanin